MNTYKALVLDPDTCLAGEIPNVTLCLSASAEQMCESMEEVEPDLIIIDLLLPEGLGALELIAELRKKDPSIPAILLTREAPSEQVWQALAAQPMIQLMRTPATPGELQYHLARLLEARSSQYPKPAPIKVNVVGELRNDESGRLDATKIAEVFGLTMAEVAECVGRPRTTIVKTPDAMSVQVKLQHFERIAGGLLTVTGSMKGLKMWLNSPAPNLDGHMPVEVLKRGKVELLAGWVDDARLGSPE
ncbi:MAG: response regulator [Candidatus Obscuribacterales bacterium]|nr:response regulator [Candidatus Obscuribacterales bacterium]